MRKGKGWKLCPSMGARANIGTTREVVDVSRDLWVFGTYAVGNRKEIWQCNHAVGDTNTEFLYLFANVSQEGIARPSANQHDCIDRNISEVHSHCCTRTDGVRAHLVGLESKNIFANRLMTARSRSSSILDET